MHWARPMPTNATATAQASATAAASATATANQAILSQATSGTPVLNDLLSAPSNNHWDQLSASNSTQSGSCAYTGGVYQSSMPTKGYFQPCYAQAPMYSNFAYQVQMTIKQGDEGRYHFSCRYHELKVLPLPYYAERGV